jgi:hypothetical protein
MERSQEFAHGREAYEIMRHEVVEDQACAPVPKISSSGFTSAALQPRPIEHQPRLKVICIYFLSGTFRPLNSPKTFWLEAMAEETA